MWAINLPATLNSKLQLGYATGLLGVYPIKVSRMLTPQAFYGVSLAIRGIIGLCRFPG